MGWIHQQCRWSFGDIQVSVVLGYGTYGGEQGLFELAILDDGVVDPIGHLEEEQVEDILEPDDDPEDDPKDEEKQPWDK